MSTRWEKLKEGLRKASSVAAEKAGLMAQVGKVKLAIATIERNIGKTERELGRYACDTLTKGKAVSEEDERAKRLVAKIASLEADLKEKRAEYEELRKEKAAKPAEEAEPKTTERTTSKGPRRRPGTTKTAT